MNTNDQGDLGETIFNLALSRYTLFRPRHLGEKWPTSDFFVELNGLDEKLFFIAQIKSSSTGINTKKRLRITAPKDKLNMLSKYYAPTFLAGIDIKKEKVYLTPITKEVTKGISSLTTTFVVNKTNSKKLHAEVKRFWKKSGLLDYKRKFINSF